MEITHTCVFKAIAVTAQQDLFEVQNANNCTARIHGFVISQETEIGDAQEEMLRLTTNRMPAGVSGSGGTTVTPRARRRGDPAFSGTVKANNTTRMASTSPDLFENLEVHSWNERVPYVFWYTPEARPLILASEFWSLSLETTPADSVTISGTLYLEVV